MWRFIAQDNPQAADRVVEATFKTFEKLGARPGLGRLRRFRDPRLKNIRSLPVAGFQNYIVFYRVVDDEVQILHIYHGARDIQSLFCQR